MYGMYMRTCWIMMISAAIATAESPRTPVLVELFTSEGCSSCPPADLLLSHLQQSQPIPGVEVITLSEHVDYWNQLGWTDPFSSAGLTERQRQYASVLRGDGVYTPQMVVDGKTGFVGSDSQKALRAIAEAAKAPRTGIELRCGANPGTLAVRIDNGPEADADVTLAIAENGLQSNVTRGENRGRLMAHAGVARSITLIGRGKKRQPFSAEPKLAIDRGWRRENLSAVVFLQDRASHRILGSGRIALSACAVN
jgi:hypothetical protein